MVRMQQGEVAATTISREVRVKNYTGGRCCKKEWCGTRVVVRVRDLMRRNRIRRKNRDAVMQEVQDEVY